MSVKRGIDVSAFQDEISWGKVSGVEFVIIRAGYGRNNIDSRALQNIKGCINNKIPFGLYWFSYALSTADATKEADYVCDIADKYKISFPVIGYDWEYDSDDYAADQDVSMTNDKRYHFAKAFLKRVKQRGYTPLIYTNYDYLNKGFRSLLSEYDVWFSYPGGNGKPDVDGLTIWQYSWEGDVPGINADVDMNYCYKDYGKGGTSASEKESGITAQHMNDTAYSLLDTDRHPDSCDIMHWFGSFSDDINDVPCCCAGMMYLFNEARALDLIPGGKVADCGSLCKNFYNAGQLYGPDEVQPGDLVILSWSKERSSYWPASELGYKTLDHVEYCVAVNDSTITCIGANNGGAECDDYQIKTRYKSNISCCCRPDYSDYAVTYDSENSECSEERGSSVKSVQSWLNGYYSTGLDVDGIYGPKTKAALVKALQTELNRQCGASLAVDGIYGSMTVAANVCLCVGAQGNITKTLQGLLICNGYDTNGFDGIFGTGTMKAVKSFQSAHGASADGIVGPVTWRLLTK